MTAAIIITLCVLLLLAYVFDLTSSKTNVPSVILLLLLGFGMRQLSLLLQIDLPELSAMLPVFGTIGLILIVLEGALELEFDASKTMLIKKAAIASFIPMITLAGLLSVLFQYAAGVSLQVGLVNAIPLCIISSAIAIPSVRSLSAFNSEFVIYESSLSDILGVLFFNFIALNTSFGLATVGMFGLQLVLIILISFAATIGLAILLKEIRHHIKFAPIVLLVLLIYAVAKVYHLPGLVFILVFGLFLGNLQRLDRFSWIAHLNPERLGTEVQKFKEFITEGAFLVRSLFFLLFGFLMQSSDLLNTNTILWAIGIVGAIFTLRAVQLRLSGLPFAPLLFIAPRGLITILLFLAIDTSQRIWLVSTSLIVQIIVLTSIVMMIGLLSGRRKHGVADHPA